MAQRADLQLHLEALFTEKPLADRPHKMDQGLVEQARQILNRPLPAERFFSRLQQTGVGDKFPDFIVSRAAGQVLERKSGKTLATGIDALYTYDAYHQGFKPRVLKLIATLENERWVLGTQVSLADKIPLLGEVRELYLREYIRQCQALLDDLALAGGRTRERPWPSWACCPTNATPPCSCCSGPSRRRPIWRATRRNRKNRPAVSRTR